MEIVIDWGVIESEEEFYDCFLPQVSAPEWHGRNLDALADSVVTGDVNKIEPPYTIYYKNTGKVPSSIASFQLKVINVFNEAASSNREIKIVSE